MNHCGSSGALAGPSTLILCSIAALRFQRRTGGFQQTIPMKHCGSSGALVDSSSPFLCSITLPAPPWWIPAPCSCSIAVPAPHWWIPAPYFAKQYGSSATLWWVPAPHFYAASRFQRRTGRFQCLTPMQHCGSSAAVVDSRAPVLCSITVPAAH